MSIHCELLIRGRAKKDGSKIKVTIHLTVVCFDLNYLIACFRNTKEGISVIRKLVTTSAYLAHLSPVIRLDGRTWTSNSNFQSRLHEGFLTVWWLTKKLWTANWIHTYSKCTIKRSIKSKIWCAKLRKRHFTVVVSNIVRERPAKHLSKSKRAIAQQ